MRKAIIKCCGRAKCSGQFSRTAKNTTRRKKFSSMRVLTYTESKILQVLISYILNFGPLVLMYCNFHSQKHFTFWKTASRIIMETWEPNHREIPQRTQAGKKNSRLQLRPHYKVADILAILHLIYAIISRHYIKRRGSFSGR